MLDSWRWYGAYDKISLSDISQTGAKGIVTALHEIPYGEIWPREVIAARSAEIRNAGFTWSVVESLPIHERIKRGDGDLSELFANYRESMRNLAAEGIKTICYNFMPLLDWTRTDLATPVAGGGTCLRFSSHKMAAFEIHMLGREAARDDYTQAVCEQATAWFEASTSAERDTLLQSIMAGLPGAYDRFNVEELRQALAIYDGIDRDTLRANFRRFLEEIIPTAESLGMKLCIHPDDPPRDILGLPRIVSDAQDIKWILSTIVSPANGLTLCAGSLGANWANDVPAIAETFAEHIHFAHLRNVRKDNDGSFEEAAHLDGDTDMLALVQVLLTEEKRRRDVGREDCSIPFRPDHGHELLSDLTAGTHPGYPLIGRMRGQAELRGVIRALSGNRMRHV